MGRYARSARPFCRLCLFMRINPRTYVMAMFLFLLLPIISTNITLPRSMCCVFYVLYTQHLLAWLIILQKIHVISSFVLFLGYPGLDRFFFHLIIHIFHGFLILFYFLFAMGVVRCFIGSPSGVFVILERRIYLYI